MSVTPRSRLTHELRLVDEGSAALGRGGRLRRGKPVGVAGAEVWVKLVDVGQPAGSPVFASLGGPAALSLLTLTSPTVRTEFRDQDGGKMAVYMLRWVNTRGEKGPWSGVTSATVAA